MKNFLTILGGMGRQQLKVMSDSLIRKLKPIKTKTIQIIQWLTIIDAQEVIVNRSLDKGLALRDD